MINRLQIVPRLVIAAAAAWILVTVFWGLASGGKRLEIPQIVIWIAIGAAAVQLVLWLASLVMRRL